MNSTLFEILREARAPALAGATWLLAIWLALRHGIDPAESHSRTAEVVDRLSTILGKAGGLLVLLAVGIGLGTVSQQVFRAPAIWIANGSTYVVGLTEALIVRALARKGTPPKLKRFSTWEPAAVDFARRMLHRHQPEVAAAAPAGKESAYQQALYVEIDRLKCNELQRADDPADGFARTLNEQAALRFSVVVPLIVLVATASIELSPWYAIFAPAPFVIAFQAGTLRALRDAALEQRVWPKVDLGAIAATL